MHRLIIGVLLLAGGGAANAATIVIVTDPMTMDRRTYVMDPRGPDRVVMCMAPPSTSGCTQVPFKRHKR